MKKQNNKNGSRARGFTMIPNSLIRSRTLSSSAFRFFCVVKSLNPSYPPYSSIRLWTGMGRKTISKSIKRLRALNMIEYERGNSHGNSNEYTILPDSHWQIPTEHNSKRKNGTRSGSISALNVVQKVNAKNTKVNNINETQSISFLSSITTTKVLNSYKQSEVMKCEAALRRALLGKRFFQETKPVLGSFVETHGALVPFQSVEALVRSCLISDRRKASADDLVQQLEPIYAAALTEYKANNAVTETKSQRKKRLKRERRRKLKKLKTEGKLMTPEELAAIQKRKIEQMAANPLFRGIFGNENEIETALRKTYMAGKERDK